MSCATEDIKANLGLTICDNPLAKGVGETIYIGRFAWLASSTADSTNKKIVRTIGLNTGKKLLHYIGQNYSNQITSGFTATENGNYVPQGLRYILFTNSAAEEAEIDSLLDKKDLFAIVKRNGNPGAWKIIGWKTGLRMTNLSSDSNDDTLKGAYTLEFQAPDEKTTYYTLQHLTTDTPAVDDTDTYVETLALALS